MGSMRCVLLGFLLCAVIGYSMGSVTCLDENGQPVDWWVIFKVPYLPDSADKPSATGYAYAYADANLPILTYQGQMLTNTSQNGLYQTLTQLYKGSASEMGWLMYNDEEPDGSTHSSYGHTKGDMVFDNESGFWLVHSVPRWPNPPPGSYEYPDMEMKYGQSFLCMSLGLPSLDSVANQFLLNKPYVYSSNINSFQAAAMPNVTAVINKDFQTKNPEGREVQIVSNGGVEFRLFAKNGAWNQSLYEDLAEPGINSGMLVETWQNGSGGKMPSFCKPEYQYDSMNVREMTINADVNWSETKDHSKWGISTDVPGWVCIGDINRMYSQYSRGGGTYCFVNQMLYSSILGFISQADYC